MKLKKVLLGFLALAPAAMFAEGSTPDVTQATSAITQTQSALTQILTTLGPAVLAVVLAGVAIWAIPRVVSSIKGAFTSGKGR